MGQTRILLVEGDAGACEVLGAALRNAGYAVETATTAAEAFAQLGRRRYAIVVADWELPEDQNGMDVLQHAAKLGTKTLIMSQHLYQTSREDLHGDPAPLHPNKLVDEVERILANPVWRKPVH